EAAIQKAVRKTYAIESEAGERIFLRATNGVVLATGSFAMNRPMVRHYAPNYAGAMALGTVGCDGAGIRLGQTAGASRGEGERVPAWRTITSPTAYLRGVVVHSGGRRFLSEDVYIGRMGEQIAALPDRKGWIVFDKPIYREAWKATVPNFKPGWLPEWLSYGFFGLMNLLTNIKKADTLRELAQKCGFDAESFERSVRSEERRVGRGGRAE